MLGHPAILLAETVAIVAVAEARLVDGEPLAAERIAVAKARWVEWSLRPNQPSRRAVPVGCAW